MKVTQLDFKENEGILARMPLNPELLLHSSLCLKYFFSTHCGRVLSLWKTNLIFNQSCCLDNRPGKRPGSFAQLFQTSRMLLPRQRCHLGFSQIKTSSQDPKLVLDRCKDLSKKVINSCVVVVVPWSNMLLPVCTTDGDHLLPPSAGSSPEKCSLEYWIDILDGYLRGD